MLIAHAFQRIHHAGLIRNCLYFLQLWTSDLNASWLTVKSRGVEGADYVDGSWVQEVVSK